MNRFKVGDKVVTRNEILTYLDGSTLTDAKEGERGEVIEVLDMSESYNVRFPDGVSLVFGEELDFVH